MNQQPRQTGLRVLLGGLPWGEYTSAEPAHYGPLTVSRWFPAWWGISPWASPFWKVEIRDA